MLHRLKESVRRRLITAFASTLSFTLALIVVVDSVSAETSSIDASTRWAFRVKAEATVASPIVRLSDVVTPVNPNLAAWPRLARAPIGLVPVGGQNMTIERSRLTSIILAAEATPRGIDWLGAETIRVRYDSHAKPTNTTNTQASTVAITTSSVAPVNYLSEPATIAETTRLTASETKRVVHWIELSMTRFQPDIAERFEIEILANQPSLQALRLISGVTDLSPLDAVPESASHSGTHVFLVEARTINGTIRVPVQIKLTAHPQIAVPSRTLGRGQRIVASDLEWASMPADEIQNDSVRDLNWLIGKEVRSPLRSGQPIAHDAVGAPILIHRGDLIEVRVLGGGVSVSTNAKALGDGAESDLIEIETLSPRKRLVARVADIGRVEILTRAPSVR